MLTCKIVPRETYDTFGILLKSDKEASGCLFLEFDKAMQRVSFLNLPMGVDPFGYSRVRRFRRQPSLGRMGCVSVRKQCKLKTERQ